MNRSEALDVWRRGLMGDSASTAEVPESPGLLGQALDILSRPVSTVMGGFFGALSPEVDVTEGMRQGFQGERHFGVYDFLVEGGFDPDARSTRLAGIAGDILNPADPTAYVGLGFTKLGKVAKGLSVAGEGAASVGKITSRAAAAEKGLWSPLTFAGHAVLPKGVSVPVARAVDAVGARVSKSKYVEALAPYLGGVKKFEAEFPGVSSMISGAKRALDVDERGFVDELVRIEDGLKAKGFDDGAVAKAMRDVTSLLEAPETRLVRAERELELVDDALAGKFVDWLPEGIDAEEAAEVTRVNFNNQKAVDRRVGELEVGLRNYDGESDGFFQKASDELHVLKSVQAARFAQDVPPLDVLVKRREALAGEVEHIRGLWDEAGPEVIQAYDALRPLLKETRELYEGVLKGYDPDFEFPVEDYVKHMFPASYSKLPANVQKARQAVEAERAALVADLAGQGYDDLSIERLVRDRMGAKGAILEAADEKGLLKGDLDAFKQRQFNMSVEDFNKWAEEGGLDARFENYSAAIASAMRRDAGRWRFGHDIHKFVMEKPGWTMGAEDYGKLSKGEQKLWKPMEFHVPWVGADKNPFAGKYMRTEVKALMEAQLTGMGKLLNDDGLNGVLGVVSGFRKWWTAWSLAPFPGSKARDLVSDIVLANAAGLNPAVDFARAATGNSAYMASLALNTRRSKFPAVKGMLGNAPASLGNMMAKVQAKFPEMTEEKLVEYMEIEGILGASAVRDLDLAAVLSNDPLMKKAREGRGTARKMLDWTPLHKDVDKSPWIKYGFGISQKQADFTRGALFFDTLMKHLPEAQRVEDALTAATATVRKFQFDYTDLTQVERDVLKNIIPFYTFSAKNIPLQIQQAATDPGRLAWVNRMYQGAWGQFEEDEIAHEDLPAWLRDLGMPISEFKAEDGSTGFSIWTPKGWLPQTELVEMADLIRGKAGSAIISRLNPLLKEPLEQLFNKDMFTQQAIEDGTVRDLFGIPAPRRAIHIVNNLRLVTEIDRIDPGGLWTKIGQQMGWWEEGRPHRWTAPGVDRATRFLAGLNVKGVAPMEQQERVVRESEREANSALSRARYAVRTGQTLEAEKFLEAMKSYKSDQAKAMTRLGELRRRNALDVARKESGR